VSGRSNPTSKPGLTDSPLTATDPKRSFMHRQSPAGFDDKADVGKLQFVASKQTFNFDDDQDRNAAVADIAYRLAADWSGPVADIAACQLLSNQNRLRPAKRVGNCLPP
jgi:hypothetical protein